MLISVGLTISFVAWKYYQLQNITSQYLRVEKVKRERGPSKTQMTQTTDHPPRSSPGLCGPAKAGVTKRGLETIS